MGKFTDRTGEKLMMSCGMEATVIAYRGGKDIDIRFSDGSERYNVAYNNFKRGAISPKSSEDMFSIRVGEKQMMSCGMEATIIAYRSSKDIDIEFSDGSKRYSVHYNNFKRGAILPTKKFNTSSSTRIGEKRVLKCGMEAEIITYRSSADIDVKFSDGSIRYNVEYSAFKKGTIVPTGFYESTRLGEKRVMNCGIEAEIIAYRSAIDIDIKFSNGVIVHNKEYFRFKLGRVRCPVADFRLGEKRVMNCGLEAEVIRYRNADDIDVKFSDGTKRLNTTYGEFKKGSLSSKYDGGIKVGEKRMMDCGMEATIISVRNKDNITIKFSDGYTRYGVSYNSFLQGSITRGHDYASKRIGEKRLMNCGMEAEIIGYRNSSDIDVRFKDGTVVTNRSYTAFFSGQIRNINVRVNNYINRKQMMSCGMEAKVVSYRGCTNIDVKFEDGALVKSTRFDRFLKGNVPHPSISRSRRGTLSSFTLEKLAYKHDSNTYYFCECQKCKLRDILTPQEILKHECEVINSE